MPDLSQYKIGVVLSVKPCPKEGRGGQPLTACHIRVGSVASESITVVTSSTNVRVNSRVVVAPVGSKFVNEDGEEDVIQKTAVGGIMSEGMLCDAKMLGWVCGGDGEVVKIPDSFPIGAFPPAEKPRSDRVVRFETENEPDLQAFEVKPLFEMKLTREEKKELAQAKRKSKKAAKEAQKKAAAATPTSNNNSYR